MKTKEIKLPFIEEDFEAGERVYQHSTASNRMRFASVEDARDGKVFVRSDCGSPMEVALDMFKFNLTANYWGKCLPLEQLQEGDTLSIDYLGAKRSNVVQEINKEQMTLRLEESSGAPVITDWDLTDSDTRGFIMRNFTLEG